MTQQPPTNSRIYLDNNGSTPLDPRVTQHIIETLPSLIGNPSSQHHFGKKARALISQARDAIARYLKVKPQEIIFTSGGSEGANLAIRGLIPEQSPCHIITCDAEHSCVHATIKLIEADGNKVTFLKPGLYGAPTPDDVLKSITPETKLIALMAVNNETGVKTDIDAIAEIALTHRIPFFVDGVALLGKEPISIPKGVSMMSFSGHKCHAPQGVGFCFIRSGTKCRPLITGGEQENGRRAGTENVLGISALGKAIELLEVELPQAMHHMESLRNRFEAGICQSIPSASINGLGPRTVNVSNIAFKGADGETLLLELDRAGIAASHGSACASGSLEPSRVLTAMGLDSATINGSIRFSISRFTTLQEIDRAIEIIKTLVRR